MTINSKALGVAVADARWLCTDREVSTTDRSWLGTA